MGITVLSLFDGCACARVALERVGMPVKKYYASEVDKWAIKIAQKNYPDIIQLGGIQAGRTWQIDHPHLIIGGSPCQGFSVAGKGGGFEDKRSALFWEFVYQVKFRQPRYFLLENVVMKQEDQQIITKILGVEPIRINSSLVSAQLRNRLYWTNISTSPPENRKISLKDVLERGVVDRDKSYCIDANYWKGTSLLKYKQKHCRQIVFTDDGHFRKLLPVECERLQTLPDNYTAGVSNTQRYKMLGNGFTVDVIAHILTDMSL